MLVHGLEFSEELIERIQAIVDEDSGISRGGLSRRICGEQGWRNEAGRLREVSCRKAIARLEREGFLRLPERKEGGWERRREKDPAPATSHVEGTLRDLGAVELVLVTGEGQRLSRTWNQLLEAYHYLGSGPLCGAQARYLFQSEHHGWIGGISFSASAWRVRARDEFIGWSNEAREKNLKKVICNSRFLIVPTIRVKHLASHLLSKSLGRAGEDWEKLYGYRPVLAETFVDVSRFRGTSYRAANWVYVGQTAGRGRQDRENRRQAGVKDIYLYGLREDWREDLTEEPARVPVRLREANDWAEEEFGDAELGDERLRKRLCEVARCFYSHPEANIPEACGSHAKAKATYRFMDNQRTTMDAILKPHYEQTTRRIAAEEVVLAIQDTSSLNYTAHPLTTGLGPINTAKDKAIGLLLHDTLAFDDSGVPLGLLDVQCWARDKKQREDKERYSLPIEDKESYKWLKSYQAVRNVQRCCPKTQVILISDRESDIYEFFVEARDSEGGPDLIIRADRGRQRKTETEPLWEQMEAEAVEGIHEVLVPAKDGKPSRIARLEVRYAQVTLTAPQRKRRLGDVTLYAVYAKEEDPPAEGTALEWMLLTTIPVNSFEDAQWILRCYSRRWGIEVYHRTLKSGCKIEDRQLGNADRILTCLAIDMVVAWRIYHLTLLGRQEPEAPCTVFFEDSEWKALVAYVTKNPIPPEQPPSLADAIKMLGALGGHLGRKSDGQPGTTYIWRGIQKLDVVTEMYKVFTAAYHDKRTADIDEVSRSP
jgi:hypothetical protein